MSLVELIITTSPITGALYAGYSNDGVKTLSIKIGVTQQAVNVVSMYMDLTEQQYECSDGDLISKSNLTGEGGGQFI
jgi:hypothetical protein